MKKSSKYFTTRKWGFGSNIVNFLKTSVYCHEHGLNLFLQDRNNTIGENYCLFSVIDLPDFIIRINALETIPIDDLKSWMKFILYEKYSFYDKVKYTLQYMIKYKNDRFIKNFNLDREIRVSFDNNFHKYIGNVFLNLWMYTPEIKEKFNQFKFQFGYENFKPTIAIQIRGGDKLEETLNQNRTSTVIEKYIEIITEQINICDDHEMEIFIMTDTYSYYKKICDIINITYPKIKIRSLVQADQEGYVQLTFNNLDKEIKINSYYFFLYELEMLRIAKICIGSYNSNIFYLASLIRYSRESLFISVDSSHENTFL